MHWSTCVGAIVFFAAALPIFAVRPFITDDARVVGRRQMQLETWVRGDRLAFQHWVLTSYGPTEPLELSLGTVQGVSYEDGRQYSVSGPLMQAKYLLRKPKAGSWPGVAVSAGALAPLGGGPFQTVGWEKFAYAAVTHSLKEGDDVLIHGNLGMVDAAKGKRKMTWGGGSQVRVRGGFHIVSEVFSGDPYADSSGIAIQAGFRHFVSEYIQLDATIGSGMTGQPRLPVWGTVGIRLVTPPLGRKVFSKVFGR